MKYKTIVQWGEENYHIEKEQKTLHKNHFRNKSFPQCIFCHLQIYTVTVCSGMLEENGATYREVKRCCGTMN